MNKNNIGWFAFLLVAGTAAAAGNVASEAELRACGHGQEREVKGAAARKSTLELKAVTPAEDSYVTSKTTVVAELEYSIDKFAPDMYQLNAQFETIDRHTTMSGEFIEHPELQYAHGMIRFCYPLRGVWNQPTLKWPLGLVFNLTHRNDDGSTEVLVSTVPTHFNTANLPAVALNRPELTADQVANREAAEKLQTFFESASVHMQLCMDSFPAMKSTLQPPLDAWHKRYARLQEKSDALYLDLMRARMPGVDAEGLRIYREAQHTALVQAIRSAPQSVSQQNCALMPGRFGDGTYDPARQHPEELKRVNALLSP